MPFTSVTVTSVSAVHEQIGALSCWQGPVEIDALDGGMTNRNFQVVDRAARYVVRIGQDLPAHGIVRWHECPS